MASRAQAVAGGEVEGDARPLSTQAAPKRRPSVPRTVGLLREADQALSLIRMAQRQRDWLRPTFVLDAVRPLVDAKFADAITASLRPALDTQAVARAVAGDFKTAFDATHLLTATRPFAGANGNGWSSFVGNVRIPGLGESLLHAGQDPVLIIDTTGDLATVHVRSGQGWLGTQFSADLRRHLRTLGDEAYTITLLGGELLVITLMIWVWLNVPELLTSLSEPVLVIQVSRVLDRWRQSKEAEQS